VLTGANGNGKSTILQALLFLRRTIEHCAEWKGNNINQYFFNKPNGLNVELNGAYCLALGSSSSILPNNSEDIFITFGISREKDFFSVKYNTGNGDQLWLEPIEVKNNTSEYKTIFKQEFYYLNAERIGPRISQNIDFLDYPNTGFQGEHVAQLLGNTEFSYTFKVDEKRRFKNEKNPRLEQQVNSWLDFIMPGVSVYASYDINTLSAQIKIENTFTKGKATIATNIGFGISYVLPIIVTGLIAKKDTYMIVENPEAHLHPSAQSNIGRFLAMIAQSGVKVIIETHSDHIINGIQIASAKNEIDNSNITINYFDRDKDNVTQPVVRTITMKKNGELTSWPKGFFDQSQQDYAELFKLRKNV
jgi:predicted ATPase